ncbi:hypothetical protein VFPPC_15113 [Pochonia chlamydosporia 170]|uniref:Uncharacterized protein n=1 Tax=Pochonia chlamydosporia 170 TaxID=1380566 RepID=A0A179G4H6_METCM|nr:hypothetical protein VFPPC_15113 [Pochonia chlamydosporia 170]OAQ72368.1 hypothetical protein VFPPC_15113 [Pochonia chlamydosporia 170]
MAACLDSSKHLPAMAGSLLSTSYREYACGVLTDAGGSIANIAAMPIGRKANIVERLQTSDWISIFSQVCRTRAICDTLSSQGQPRLLLETVISSFGFLANFGKTELAKSSHFQVENRSGTSRRTVRR